MFDDLAAYYHEDVVTAYVDYRDTSGDGIAGRSRDLRRALIAATALFHLREHLPHPQPSRAEIERLCPDYALIGDVVNAAKHRTVTSRTPHGPPFVTDATQLGEQITLTEYTDEEGVYRYAQKFVVVKLQDGGERNLLDVLTNVINFWERHLNELGVLAEARMFEHGNMIRYRSRAESEANRLNFEIVKGQRFHQSMRLLRFNNATGKAEPIDLTGSELKFRIYKPNFEIDLSLVHEATGREFKRKITLSEEESEIVASLQTDSEKQEYINALPVAQEALHQLAVEAGLGKKQD